MAVKVDQTTVSELDVPPRRGPPLADDAIKMTDQLIVAEIVSPTSRARDTGAKRVDYVRIPSLRHDIILRTHDRTPIHHGRTGAGAITTRIIHDGRIDLSGVFVLDGVFPPPTQA